MALSGAAAGGGKRGRGCDTKKKRQAIIDVLLVIHKSQVLPAQALVLYGRSDISALVDYINSVRLNNSNAISLTRFNIASVLYKVHKNTSSPYMR